ncbi:MAG TPA: hypothetical protein DCM27_01635 [Rhodospirillaceae bacterium]|nr:hypothetical protein [Rhodospirillaceae bacterium]
MGYHITILRTSGGKKSNISLDEVKEVAQTTGEWVFTDTPPTFTFKEPTKSPVLWYNKGELWGDFAGQHEQLEPLIALADSLKARARGEELETYTTADETYLHPDDAVLEKEAKVFLQQSLKEQKRIRNIIIGFFIVLGIIAFCIGKSFEK